MGRPALTRALEVRINGRLAGDYRFSPSGGVSFTYAAEWLDWAPAFPISRQLPLRTDVQTGDHVHAVFENLLPDSPDLRRRIAERTSAQSDRPHDLLAAIGRDCVGAMQFLPPGADPGDPFAIHGQPQSEAEIAATLRDLATTPLGLRPGEAFRISLAGSQEKTAYLRHQGAWMKPMGLTPTTHIFKRPMGMIGSIDMRDSVENEWLCLQLAGAMGFPVNAAEMAQFEDQRVLIVTRFDRATCPQGGLLRLPQEDFLQALGIPSAKKYQDHGGPGMREGFTLLEGSMARAADQVLILKAQIVNWMLGAIDGHAKNYSLALTPGGSRMTPLYDILSAAPTEAAFRHKDLRMAMAVGNRRHYRLDHIQPRHFDETAEAARVPPALRRQAFADLAEAAPGAVETVAARLPANFPARVAEPILTRARACAERLNPPA